MRVINVTGLGEVTVSKHRRQRRITVRVAKDGSIRARVPFWLPYQAAAPLCRQHAEHLRQLQQRHHQMVVDGQRVGRNHTIVIRGDIQRSFIKNGAINVPKHNPNLNQEARRLMVEALRRETKERIVPRVHQLARQHQRQPQAISVKAMTSRWGSCSSRGTLNLSVYCAQLDDDLLDYVITHELCHLEHLNHSRDFWAAVEVHVPQYRELRKQLRQHRPEPEFISP